MTRSQRRLVNGYARLMPNRRERFIATLSWVVDEAKQIIPELLLGIILFGFVFFILPIVAILFY